MKLSMWTDLLIHSRLQQEVKLALSYECYSLKFNLDFDVCIE